MADNSKEREEILAHFPAGKRARFAALSLEQLQQLKKAKPAYFKEK